MYSFDLLTIFTTGLFAGGITCMVVQGGLMTAVLARPTPGKNVLPILSFLLAKLFVYTALGLLLGYIGNFFRLSISLQIILQLAVIVFMFGTVMALTTNYPLFRYFIFPVPTFIQGIINKKRTENNLSSPFIAGVLTVFIPCGVIQAMMGLAVATGSPLRGALIMFLFILGTTPLFFLLGFIAMRLGSLFKKRFAYVSASLVLFLMLFNINKVLALSGNGMSLQSVARDTYCIFSFCQEETMEHPVSEQRIGIYETGYVPGEFAVKAGEMITLHLTNNNSQNCTQAFSIPRLNLSEVVPLGESKSVSFTAPSKPGILSYMCSMGMYVGKIHVI